MSSQTAHIYSLKDLSVIISTIWTGTPLVLKWAEIKGNRSNSANALYWVWMTTIADFFTKKEGVKYKKRIAKYGAKAEPGNEYTKDQIHTLMCFKFLETEDLVIGNTVIPNQLRSTAKLDVFEFTVYMMQVDSWATNLQIPLPRPEANEYTGYWQAQQ